MAEENSDFASVNANAYLKVWIWILPGKKSEQGTASGKFQRTMNDDETSVLRTVTKLLVLLIPITTRLRI